MAIALNFLESDSPLTKEFNYASGELSKTAYPIRSKFTSHEVQVSSLKEFREAVIDHASLGHCLLKGQLDRPLINESRAGHTNGDAPTQWLILDVDGLPYTPEETMRHLGLDHVTYFTQFSSSSGLTVTSNPEIRGGYDRYHIFFLLDDVVRPERLKAQVMEWNLHIPAFSSHLRLTNSNIALSYPLDVTVCQNDKLIYIAPPLCGEGVVDILGEKRIGEIING